MIEMAQYDIRIKNHENLNKTTYKTLLAWGYKIKI